MLLNPNPKLRSRGFTLVEMLVAMAVTIFLMAILTQAFVSGIDVFRRLKAVGDMNERLRMASTSLRDDLTRPHFNAAGAGVGGQNLLDDGLRAQDLNNAYSGGWTPPQNGFFRIWQGQMRDLQNTPQPIVEAPWVGNMNIATPLPFALEGTDSDGLMFCRANTHILHMTVRRRGTSLDDMFRCRDMPRLIPNNPFSLFPRDYVFPTDYRENTGFGDAYFTSRWAEVAYFLVANGEFTTGGQVPRYTLQRRLKLVVPPSGSGVPAGNIPAYPVPPSGDISTRTVLPQFPGTQPPFDPTPGQYYNRPVEVTQPRFRSFMQPAPNTASVYVGHTPQLAGLMAPTYWAANRYPSIADELGIGNMDAGNDVLLHDVISFEVKAWWDVPAPTNQAFQLTPTEIAFYQPRQSYNYPGFGVIPNSDYPFDYIPFSTKNAYFAINPTTNVPLARVFDTWSQAGPYGRRTPNGNPRPPGPPPSPPGLPPGPPPGPPGQSGNREEWERFDVVTWPETSPRLPVPIRIKALQIRIRVWDAKSEQTRQLTIIQDM